MMHLMTVMVYIHRRREFTIAKLPFYLLVLYVAQLLLTFLKLC